MNDKKKIVVIGGGTGSVSILNGLKGYADLDISVVVSMTDDGGSNEVVRDEFGLLPLSDLRKSIIALAQGGNGLLRELFMYRFSKGEGLSGHTLGNLIMMALSDIAGSERQAVKEAEKIFNILGGVYPVTFDDVRLVAEYSDGSVVIGEHYIDEPEDFDENIRIVKFHTDKEAIANPEAVTAIEQADYIIIGPGDLYTSLLANVIIKGIPEAIQESKGEVLLVANLMTRQGQTHWMTGQDFMEEVENYIGRKVKSVFVNSREISNDVLDRYAGSGEFPLENNYDESRVRVIEGDLIGDREIVRTSGDTLIRSLIRHDSKKLASTIFHYIYK